MTSLGDFNDLLKRKLDGTGIVVHALYRRVKPGLAGKEYFLTGLIEQGDTKKYFDAKMDTDQLPSVDADVQALAEHVAGELRNAFKTRLLMN